jgi:hypothetical protein
MSATLRYSARPDRALFSSAVGPTVITNAAMTYGAEFTLTAGTYTFTVTHDGITRWSQSGVVIADAHIYAMPRIESADSATSAGAVTQVV